ncbi:MAG: hypothetical protein CVU96_02345 [Firmicutes bacterium HGW-Firmicutes-20]|nr:MAG: hypothetical protein CVU96_02345 [Firmicutes bacterium HGW-Firmicutes-20]
MILTFAFVWFLWAGKDLIDYNNELPVQSLSFKQNFSEVNNITIHGGLADTIILTLDSSTQISANITGHLDAIRATRESRDFIIGSPSTGINITQCSWFKECPPVSRLVSIEVIIPFDFTGNIFIYGVTPTITVSSPRMTNNFKYLAINTAESKIEINNVSSDIFINTAKLDLTVHSIANSLSVNSTSANINYTPAINESVNLNISAGFVDLSILQMPNKGVLIESTGINTTMIEDQIERRYFASQSFEFDYESSENKIDVSVNALYAIINIDKKITP